VFVRIARAVGDCQFVVLRHFAAPKITSIIREQLERAFAAEGLRADEHCVFLNRESEQVRGGSRPLSRFHGQRRLVGLQFSPGMPCAGCRW
jgi:hypothetical protein